MLSQVAFSSQFRYERIDIKSSQSFSTAGVSVSLTIPHNLGYSPYFRCYVLFSGDDRYYYLTTANPNVFYGNSGQAGVEGYYADTTNLYCTFDNFTSGTLSGTFYYRIYAEPQT